MSTNEEIYQVADELRTNASWGLKFAKDPYDIERYNRVLNSSARLVATLEKRSVQEVLEQYQDNMNHVSPISAADAAVFQDEKVLLIKRADNGRWAFPGGLVEAGETLAEATQRELFEETNVRGQVSNLLGIFDSRLWHSRTKSHMFICIFHVIMESTNPPSAGPETTDVGFFSEKNLPDLSPGHHLQVPFVFKQIRGESPIPYFDPTN